jgi:hypothetical protein
VPKSPNHHPRVIAKEVILAEGWFFAPFGFLLGLAFLAPAAIVWFLEENVKPPAVAVSLLFAVIALVLILLRQRTSYDASARQIRVRRSLLGLGHSRCYAIDDYRSIGFGSQDDGPDLGSHDSTILNLTYYSIYLNAKKGKKDLLLHWVAGSRVGWFPAGKRHAEVAERVLKTLPLPVER